VWSFLTYIPRGVKDERWLSLLQTVKQFPPTLKLGRLRLPHILLLPPLLPQLHSTPLSDRARKALAPFRTVAAIYSRKISLYDRYEQLWTPAPVESRSIPLERWTQAASRIPQFKKELPQTANGGFLTLIIACIIAVLVWTEAREYLYGEAGYEFSVDRGVAHDLQLNFDATVATPCHCTSTGLLRSQGARVLRELTALHSPHGGCARCGRRSIAHQRRVQKGRRESG